MGLLCLYLNGKSLERLDLVLLIFLSLVAEFKVYSSCPKTLIKVKGLLKFHPNGGAVRKMKMGVFLK